MKSKFVYLVITISVFIFLSCFNNSKSETKKIDTVAFDNDFSIPIEKKIKKLIADRNNGNNPPPTNGDCFLIPMDVANTYDGGFNRRDNFESFLNLTGGFGRKYSGGVAAPIFYDPTPYWIFKDISKEPMRTIATNEAKISGLFFTFGKNPGINGKIILIIGLSKIDIAQESNMVREKIFYPIINGKKQFFKCTNLEEGTWVRIEENEKNTLINNFAGLSSTTKYKGYYVGKQNFESLNNYIYLGYKNDGANSTIHLIKTAELLKRKRGVDAQGRETFDYHPANDMQFYTTNISSINRLLHPPVYHNSCEQQHSHGGIRPCPEFCPE